MEESSNIQEANEENIGNENDNETTSRNNVTDPDMKSDNMKDLKSLDFNSADDVRYKII